MPTQDKLLAIWILHKAGFSFRRIARILGHPKTIINRWYKQACCLLESSKWDTPPYIMRGKIKFIHLSDEDISKVNCMLKVNGVWKEGKSVYVRIPREELKENKNYARRQRKDTLKQSK